MYYYLWQPLFEKSLGSGGSRPVAVAMFVRQGANRRKGASESFQLFYGRLHLIHGAEGSTQLFWKEICAHYGGVNLGQAYQG